MNGHRFSFGQYKGDLIIDHINFEEIDYIRWCIVNVPYFFLTDEEREAANDGYIYIHDKGARLDCTNCCLFDMKTVLSGGFEMGNMHYNEPKSIDVAFSVMTDIIFNAGSSQYGGFTVSEVDKLLSPYAKKSYDKYFSEYLKLTNNAEQAGTLAVFAQKLGTSYFTGVRICGTMFTDDTTSDARRKHSIEPIREQYEIFFDNLLPKRYKYINGTSDRYHTGFIAQDVLSSLEKANLTSQEFAGIMLL